MYLLGIFLTMIEVLPSCSMFDTSILNEFDSSALIALLFLVAALT